MPECHSGEDCPAWYKCRTFPDKSECPHRREYLIKTNHKRYKAWIKADFDAFCNSRGLLMSSKQREIAHSFLQQVGAQYPGAVDIVRNIYRYVRMREPFDTVYAECPQCGKGVMFPRNTEAEFLCSECGEWLNKPGCVVIPKEE